MNPQSARSGTQCPAEALFRTADGDYLVRRELNREMGAHWEVVYPDGDAVWFPKYHEAVEHVIALGRQG